MKALYGIDSMPETAENFAQDYKVARIDQDKFAVRSQERASKAQANGRLAKEIVAVTIPQHKGDPIVVDKDEHPRATSVEQLAKLKPIVREGGTITAGNASGVNDGAAALLIASAKAVAKYNLNPIARVVGGAVAGVPPRVMGIGPGAGHPEAAGPQQAGDSRPVRDRAQRGLRRARLSRAARAWDRRRCRECEP